MIFQKDLPDELLDILTYLESKYQYSILDLKVPTCAGSIETASDENH